MPALGESMKSFERYFSHFLAAWLWARESKLTKFSITKVNWKTWKLTWTVDNE